MRIAYTCRGRPPAPAIIAASERSQLAIAVFVDAFVVRSLLLPALLQLLGCRTWWLPTWFDRRMPRLATEPPLRPAEASDEDVAADKPALTR